MQRDQDSRDERISSKPASIILVHLSLLDRGALRALADLTLMTPDGPLTIRGFRVIQSPRSGFWIGFPSSAFVQNGRVVSKPILRLPRSLRHRIINVLLTSFQRAATNVIQLPGASKGSAPGRGQTAGLSPGGRVGGGIAPPILPAGAPRRDPSSGGDRGAAPRGARGRSPRLHLTL
jgi:hypothetical protein